MIHGFWYFFGCFKRFRAQRSHTTSARSPALRFWRLPPTWAAGRWEPLLLPATGAATSVAQLANPAAGSRVPGVPVPVFRADKRRCTTPSQGYWAMFLGISEKPSLICPGQTNIAVANAPFLGKPWVFHDLFLYGYLQAPQAHIISASYRSPSTMAASSAPKNSSSAASQPT